MEHMISPVWTMQRSALIALIKSFMKEENEEHYIKNQVCGKIISLYSKSSQSFTIETKKLSYFNIIEFNIKLSRFNHNHEEIRSGIFFLSLKC